MGRTTNIYYADPPAAGQTLPGYLIAIPSGSVEQPGELAGSTSYTYGGPVVTSVTDAYTYDALGDQIQDITTNSTSGQAVETDTAYDSAGRVIATTSNKVIGDPIYTGVTTSTHYNTLGQVDYSTDQYTGVTYNYYDADGNLVETISPNGLITRTAYDALNRPYLTMDAFVATSPISGSGWQTVAATSTVPAGALGTETTYNNLGQAIGTTRASGVQINISLTSGVASETVNLSIATTISSTSTAYNADGTVQSTTDAATGLVTTYTYYPNGQQQSVNVAGNITTYTYDTAGRQQSVTDPLGHTTTYLYDTLGQLTTTIYADGTQVVDGYDVLGNKITETEEYNPTHTTDPTITTYTYDSAGHLLTVTEPAVLDGDPLSSTFGDMAIR